MTNVLFSPPSSRANIHHHTTLFFRNPANHRPNFCFFSFPVLGEWWVFWSVCRCWTDRSAWLDFMAESVWGVFSREPRWLPTFSLFVLCQLVKPQSSAYLAWIYWLRANYDILLRPELKHSFIWCMSLLAYVNASILSRHSWLEKVQKFVGVLFTTGFEKQIFGNMSIPGHGRTMKAWHWVSRIKINLLTCKF